MARLTPGPALRPFGPDSTLPQSSDAVRAPTRHKGPPFQADLAFRRPALSGLYTAARAASPFLAGSTEFTLACRRDGKPDHGRDQDGNSGRTACSASLAAVRRAS